MKISITSNQDYAVSKMPAAACRCNESVLLDIPPGATMIMRCPVHGTQRVQGATSETKVTG